MIRPTLSLCFHHPKHLQKILRTETISSKHFSTNQLPVAILVAEELLSVASNFELEVDNVVSTAVSDLEPRGTSPVKGDKPKFIQTLRGVSIHREWFSPLVQSFKVFR